MSLNGGAVANAQCGDCGLAATVGYGYRGQSSSGEKIASVTVI